MTDKIIDITTCPEGMRCVPTECDIDDKGKCKYGRHPVISNHQEQELLLLYRCPLCKTKYNGKHKLCETCRLEIYHEVAMENVVKETNPVNDELQHFLHTHHGAKSVKEMKEGSDTTPHIELTFSDEYSLLSNHAMWSVQQRKIACKENIENSKDEGVIETNKLILKQLNKEYIEINAWLSELRKEAEEPTVKLTEEEVKEVKEFIDIGIAYEMDFENHEIYLSVMKKLEKLE